MPHQECHIFMYHHHAHILCLIIAHTFVLRTNMVSCHRLQFPPELHYLKSKLQLVDLAGSERAKGTGAEGESSIGVTHSSCLNHSSLFT